MVKAKKNVQITGSSLNLEGLIKGTHTMMVTGRGKNSVPSHIYKAIKEYHAKGYTAKKVGQMVKKEFPDDIKISKAKWSALVSRTIYNTKARQKELAAKAEEADVQNHIKNNNFAADSDELGIFDGDEVVSNVRPSVYKPSEDTENSIVNWELNNTAKVTTKNGDVITIEFSDKTLTELIKNTLN